MLHGGTAALYWCTGVLGAYSIQVYRLEGLEMEMECVFQTATGTVTVMRSSCTGVYRTVWSVSTVLYGARGRYGMVWYGTRVLGT
ncbi:hypothetical protein BZA05DRAFT_412707 [Tricharina praecox]|uniref:uncharacterized protein n=1 Tax=Tricharina praecox TaxID=43433 RepID=UPI00221E73BC|nr:uncharacterized protein BZA05DRAFT_412707 [Tricharina praecox]KAI5842052.1 hypothetical protein BZA05DRAFT_412707 [Tricharina praecox]